MSDNLNLGVGLHENVSAADYHSDRLCEMPTLSRSLAEVIVSASPLHAFYAHPRLGALPEGAVEHAEEEQPNAKMDFGSLGHKRLLGAGDEIAVGDFDDWRTKASKEFRSAARADGKIPVLVKTWIKGEALAVHATKELKRLGLWETFCEAKSETVAIFDEAEGVRCRVMFDKLLIDQNRATIFDIKITESANPKVCERQIQNMKYDLQEGAYRSAVQKVFPHLAGREQFIFLFIEDSFPFTVTPIELDGEFKANGISKWNYAVQVWRKCLELNQWPAYTDKIIRVSPKPWALAETFGLEMPEFKEATQ